MNLIRRMERNYFLIIIVFVTIFITLLYFTNSSNPQNNLLLNEQQTIQSSALINLHEYSKWPKFSVNSDEQFASTIFKNGNKTIHLECFEQILNDNSFFSIGNFMSVIKTWSVSTNIKCYDLYQNFKKIYNVLAEKTSLQLTDEFKPKVMIWLGNSEQLMEGFEKQELIQVYNRYTHEENVYNLLRGKRPIKQPDVNPDTYYQNLISETESKCDFCRFQNNTAIPEFGRIESQYAFTAANAFPFDKYHSMFMPRKHDLLKLHFEEFKDLFYLPIQWFKKVNSNDPAYVYPVILWDFMPKGGASQVHPHLQGTMDDKRYHGIFEIIRNGAEIYYRETRNNYFSDFLKIHEALGLTYKHKEAVLVVPITPKKEYDVTILSDNFNDSVVELLHSILMVYIQDMHIYPFSLSVYYPSLDTNSNGQIPLYIKIIPRGDISSVRSELSSLELLSTFNVNVDQYNTIAMFKNLLNARLRQFS